MVCVLVTRAQSWDCVGSFSTNRTFLSIYILSAVYFYIIVDVYTVDAMLKDFNKGIYLAMLTNKTHLIP